MGCPYFLKRTLNPRAFTSENIVHDYTETSGYFLKLRAKFISKRQRYQSHKVQTQYSLIKSRRSRYVRQRGTGGTAIACFPGNRSSA